MASKIQLRRDSSGNWSATNPVLAEGEMGVELDTNRSKLGDGTSNWNDIDYMTDTNAVGTYDANYLIKNRNVGDQTVVSTGTTTFNGRGEFGGGIKVTGGNDPIEASIYGATGALNLSDGIGRRCVFGPFNTIFDNRSTPADTTGNNTGYIFRHNNSTTGDVNAVDCVSASLTADLHDKNVESVALFSASELTLSNIDNLDAASGFRCSDSLLNKSGNTAAFRAEIQSGNGTNFNFYAEGTAPNYFAGPLILDPNSLGVYNGDGFLASKTNTGIRLFANSSEPGNNRFEISSGWRGSSSNQAIVFSGPTSGTDPTPVLRGSIRVSDTNVIYTTDSIGTPAFVEFGDARNRTFTDFNGNAADTIKLLQPKVNGFNPAQLQAVVANAVTGTENEEEAIGTLYDFDGTVLETEVTEPPVEAQSYVTEEGETRVKSWTPTGTRPVYQGVDQTKLIPLLCKALQEALDRIEELESGSGGGGSELESRLTTLEADMARIKAI